MFQHRGASVVTFCLTFLLIAALPAVAVKKADENQSWSNVSRARFWMEGLLFAIRRDLSRPTVHARNLFHVSASLWDCWASYAPDALQYLHKEKSLAKNNSLVNSEREICMSYAAYSIIKHRFALSPGKNATFAEMDRKMMLLGFDVAFNDSGSSGPAGLGLRVANTFIQYGKFDGSNEQADYTTTNSYAPKNPPLAPTLPDSIRFVENIDHWQPLAVGTFQDQSGVVLSSYPAFTTPHWGSVLPFALTEENRTSSGLYLDPGEPPRLSNASTSPKWRQSHLTVLEYSSWLDPSDNVTIDCSPASRGNNTFGTNDGTGYKVNPKTGLPYTPQYVKRGDYARVLAEFWADGPNSETPPGHWNVILGNVSYQSGFSRRWAGHGPSLSPLEWDVRAYLTLNGAMHDCAITCWAIKNVYDTSRPVTALRRMAWNGQSTEPLGTKYNHDGITLIPGLVEMITFDSSRPGQRHSHLAGHVGEIAFKAWRNFVSDARNYSGVGWILGTEWFPYQLQSFVSPPFAGYTSGHSTYSRAAASILTIITGDGFFPGGMGEFIAEKDKYLVFEKGPSTEVRLQWATFFDAADESGISRIYGGIHPPIDDIPGRIIGSKLGPMAVQKASSLFPPAKLGTVEIVSISVISAELFVLFLLVGFILWRRNSLAKTTKLKRGETKGSNVVVPNVRDTPNL